MSAADAGVATAPAGQVGEEPDWAEWMRRYDVQQEVYIPARERRFEMITDLVEALAPPGASVVDLGAGPGSLSTRLLARLPGTRCVALDADPVMIEFGRRAAGDATAGRLRWLRSDVVDEDWRAAVLEAAGGEVHAVVSSTALHWLPAAELMRVYRDIALLLPKGGVFVSGDLLLLPTHLDRIQLAVDQVREKREAAARAGGAEDWGDWWKALEHEAQGHPGLAAAFKERAGISMLTRSQARVAGTAFHLAALDEAGFTEAATAWQDLEEFVLVATK